MLGDADLRHYLPALCMPVAVIVGEEDYATPVLMAQQSHEALRRSTLTILPDARPLTPIECPEQIASQFLRCCNGQVLDRRQPKHSRSARNSVHFFSRAPSGARTRA
jgi:pimeloyl-ACP methyl ester carboxylesterase